jgi:hypothetical protein
MTLSDWMMIVAVAAAPFLAVYAQRHIDLWREKRGKKSGVFKTLMATRARPLSLDHVQALNTIELEFTDKSDADVLAAWREYHDHLSLVPREGDNLPTRMEIWSQKTQELLTALLAQMGKGLGYKLDAVQIRKGSYFPEAHAVQEVELQLMRKALVEWLAGDKPVGVTLLPQDAEADKRGEEFRNSVLALLNGRTSIKVQIAAGEVGGSDGPQRAAGLTGEG